MDSKWHSRYFPDRDIHFCCPGCRKNAELAMEELFGKLFDLALAAAGVCDRSPNTAETEPLRRALAALDTIAAPAPGPHACTGGEGAETSAERCARRPLPYPVGGSRDRG